MATVIIAIIVFALVGLAVWYIIRSHVRHTGSCSGSCSGCSACKEPDSGSSCDSCSSHSNDTRATKKESVPRHVSSRR